MKFKTFLWVVPCVCLLAACSVGDGRNSDETSEPSTMFSTPQPTDSNGWVEVKPGIYDISSLVQVPDSMSVADVFFDQRLLLTFDTSKGAYALYPFDVESLKMTQEMTSINGNLGMECEAKGNYIVLSEPSDYVSEHLVNVYDYIHREEASWSLNPSTKVGKTYDQDSALLMLSTEDEIIRQHVYSKNFETSGEKTLLDWEITDGTQKPFLVSVSQGQNGIAFIGTIYPAPNLQSDTCVGLIDNQGNLMDMKKLGAYDVAYYNGGLVVYDSTPAIGQNSERLGHFEVYDADTLTVTEVTPETDNEISRRITVSENGKYIVTKDGDSYRVYDTEKNVLLKKFDFVVEMDGLVQETIYIAERDRGVLMLTQGESDRRLHYVQF